MVNRENLWYGLGYGVGGLLATASIFYTGYRYGSTRSKVSTTNIVEEADTSSDNSTKDSTSE